MQQRVTRPKGPAKASGANPSKAQRLPARSAWNREMFAIAGMGSKPKEEAQPVVQRKDEDKEHSARLKGDHSFKKIFAGSKLAKGSRGMQVVKLQQALVDLGYSLNKFGVDGIFWNETQAAVKAFQKDHGLSQTGALDKATIEKMDAKFDTRKPYLAAAAEFDPADPNKGSRNLPADQAKAALEALKPQPGKPGAKFTPKVGAKEYGAEIKKALAAEIKRLHKELYADKVALRADPAKNFHKDKQLEDAANAGKVATDVVYGDLAKGPAFKMGTNLIDQWKDEEDRNRGKSATWKKEKARDKVQYLIDSNCGDVNKEFNANPSGTEEKAILDPIVDSFIDTDPKVQTMLEIEMGWEGAQLEGTQYLQLYKDPSKEKNRLAMWSLFHVSIHEYIHSLAHTRYNDWADKLGGSQRHTLVEGFCDFFTLNVRAKYSPATLLIFKTMVEGAYFDVTKPVPKVEDLNVGVYDSNAEAERAVGIVGIRNAQLAYFRGQIEKLGGK